MNHYNASQPLLQLQASPDLNQQTDNPIRQENKSIMMALHEKEAISMCSDKEVENLSTYTEKSHYEDTA